MLLFYRNKFVQLLNILTKKRMGSIVGKVMEESMVKQQQMMRDMQEITVSQFSLIKRYCMNMEDLFIKPLECFFSIKHVKGHVALDRNRTPGYSTLLLLLIPGDLLYNSACLHRQFHTLLSLLQSLVALTNSYLTACVPSSEAVCTIFMVFGMTWVGRANP